MNFLIILILTAVLQFFTPWWTIALVPFFIMAWRPAKPGISFLTGFLAIALIWFSYGFYLHHVSEGILSNRIAELFSLPGGFVLLIITTLIGGIVGGLGALSGSFIRQTTS